MYNQHITISNNPYRRTAWEISKVEDTAPYGVTKITLKQELEHDSKDNFSWVNITSDNISDINHGAAYDFFKLRTNDQLQHIPTNPLEVDESIISFSGVKPHLKCGGSYKTYTASFYKGGKLIEVQPYWSISYIVGNEEVCKINFTYDTNTLVPSGTNIIVSKDRKITCGDGFSIQYSYSADMPYNLKIRCLSNLSMIGNKLVIAASNNVDLNASIEVGVDGL